MTKTELIDKKIELMEQLQAELDRRHALEDEVLNCFSKGDFEHANEILASIDDNIILDIQSRIDDLSAQAPEREQSDIEFSSKDYTVLMETLLSAKCTKTGILDYYMNGEQIEITSTNLLKMDIDSLDRLLHIFAGFESELPFT